jgi:hypothetical protein
MSEAQRQKLSEAQRRYISSDPRWAAHRAKLAQAQQDPDRKAKHSEAQLAYMAQDPRWSDHQASWRAAAVEVTKLTLLPEEIKKAVELRRKGRTFEYIGEELCVSDRIIRREFRALDLPTGRVPRRSKAKRGKEHWRSFDPPDAPSPIPVPRL